MPSVQTGRVKVEEAVTFGTGGGRPLRCDVYLPPEPGAGRPGLLLVHGGGWQQGDRSQLRGYGILLGRLGYVCVACEYRLSGEARWPAQLHDVKAALRWMRANRSALGLDPSRIAVSGNSAGGHLALMLAATPKVAELSGEGGNAAEAEDCAAAIAFYAPTQLAVPAATDLDSAVGRLFGPGADAVVARRASPIAYAHRGFPPTLLLHGNRDELVPETASLRMYEVLAGAGAAAELHLFNGAPHAFDSERELGRRCADLMALFLERHVGPAA
jgi:acetyl esterase/lipase